MSEYTTVDALSQLFQRLELRAEGLARLLVLDSPWGIAVPARSREFNMYSVRKGVCFLDRSGHDPLELRTGDSALVLKDVPHSVHDGSKQNLKPQNFWLERRLTGCAAAAHTPEAEKSTWLISETFTLSGSLACTVSRAIGDCVVLRADEEAIGPWQQNLFNMLCLEATSPRPGTAFVYSRLMELFFIEFIRACAGRKWNNENGNLLRVLFDSQLLRAVEKVHNNPEYPWTVESLARAAGMSRTAFAIKFSTLAGITPLTYVTQWRMAQAEALLISGQTLGEVAAKVGYESEAAFSRAFKRETGQSPGSLRRRKSLAAAELTSVG